jgi:hypothetical protein
LQAFKIHRTRFYPRSDDGRGVKECKPSSWFPENLGRAQTALASCDRTCFAMVLATEYHIRRELWCHEVLTAVSLYTEER